MISQVDRKPVKDVDDFAKKIETVKGQESVLLLIQRGQMNLFAAVKPK